MKAREAAKPAWAADPPRKAPLILRYAYLRQHPQVFKVMTGLTVPLFDELCGDVRPRLAEAVYAERKMQVGGGRAQRGHHRRGAERAQPYRRPLLTGWSQATSQFIPDY